MRLIKKYLPLLILFMSSLFAQNNYPIVPVHGFLGWGPQEMVGYKYWGGFPAYTRCSGCCPDASGLFLRVFIVNICHFDFDFRQKHAV